MHIHATSAPAAQENSGVCLHGECCCSMHQQCWQLLHCLQLSTMVTILFAALKKIIYISSAHACE
jgi:hypothetical protein